MKVLIVVDVQNDFCPGGSLAVEEGDRVVPVVNELMRSGDFDLKIASKDWHPAKHMSFQSNNPGSELFTEIELNGSRQMMWPNHCVQNTLGAEFHPNLATDLIDYVVEKGIDTEVDSYSAFFDNNKVRETSLRSIIEREALKRGIENPNEIEVVVCGLATDYCVAFTARDSAELGYQTSLVLDASRPVDSSPDSQAKLIRELAQLGISVVESRELLPQDRSVERESERVQGMQP